MSGGLNSVANTILKKIKSFFQFTKFFSPRYVKKIKSSKIKTKEKFKKYKKLKRNEK
jgi:hypothetical protein